MTGQLPIGVKVCIPIVGPGLDEAFQQIRASAPSADLLELRLDLIREGSPAELLWEIHRNDPLVKIVATHRKVDESGLPPRSGEGVPEERRIAVLQESVRLGADYVDLELGTAAALRDSLKGVIADCGGRTRLIVSCHNFEETPSDDDLTGLWEACREAGAGVIKIVTLARTVADNLRVMRLIPMSLEQGQEIVAFAMGEPGKISRILAPMLGAHFTFAALDKSAATAPGQLTMTELTGILKILGGVRIGKSE